MTEQKTAVSILTEAVLKASVKLAISEGLYNAKWDDEKKLDEISRDWIMKNLGELYAQKGEALGDMASHSMDLSDVYENTENRFNAKIRYLENLLKV